MLKQTPLLQVEINILIRKISTINKYSCVFQVAEKIRVDERVSIIERTNLRYLPGLPELVDLVTLDLSFISILLVGLATLLLQ